MDPTFADLLNLKGLVPRCREGQVTLGSRYDDADVTLFRDDLDKVGFLRGYLEEHPEGSDRGGYVPTVFSKDGQTAYYDETGCCWLADNGGFQP